MAQSLGVRCGQLRAGCSILEVCYLCGDTGPLFLLVDAAETTQKGWFVCIVTCPSLALLQAAQPEGSQRLGTQVEKLRDEEVDQDSAKSNTEMIWVLEPYRVLQNASHVFEALPSLIAACPPVKVENGRSGQHVVQHARLGE